MILVTGKGRAPKKRKADGEQTTLKDMIGRNKISILEIEVPSKAQPYVRLV